MLTLRPFFVCIAMGWSLSAAEGNSLLPSCEEVMLQVPIVANASVLPASFDPIEYKLDAHFNISGRYCRPQSDVLSRRDVIQLLVHGATYDKNYWSGLGFPGFQGNNYSWISYASMRGYATLSVDCLGYANSSHPDPISIDQAAVQEQIFHTIVQQLKQPNSALDQSFKRVVYVGHSTGSVFGAAYARRYPDDLSALILTGYSNLGFSKSTSSLWFESLAPSYLTNPDRFDDLAPGYLSWSNKSARELAFYSKPGIDFNPAIFELGWETPQTVGYGELLTDPSPEVFQSLGQSTF